MRSKLLCTTDIDAAWWVSTGFEPLTQGLPPALLYQSSYGPPTLKGYPWGQGFMPRPAFSIGLIQGRAVSPNSKESSKGAT